MRLENKTYDELSVGETASLKRIAREDDFLIFATASGNHNPLHIAAYDGDGDGETEAIAPSLWVGSLISAVLGNVLPGPGTLYRSQSFDFVGHAEAVNLQLEKPLTADEARGILREAPGILVVDKQEDGGYVTPVECVGDYATFVSRIREDSTIENGLNLWIVSDNLRKGAALNTVQIAETLVNRNLLDKAA